MLSCGFYVFDGATAVSQNRVHVEFALAIGLERVIVAIDEYGGSGQKPRVHAHALASVDLDYDEALPVLAIAFNFRSKFFQENLFELYNFSHIHAGDKRLSSGDGSIGQDDVLEFVIAWGQDRCALVDLGRIEEIEDRKVLHRQHAIHAFDAQATLAVEEIGDVSLLESCLLRQTESGQVAFFNASPESVAEIFLKHSEFHAQSIPPRYSHTLT